MATANLFIGCKSAKEVHNKLMIEICCNYFGSNSRKCEFEKFRLKSFVYLKSPSERFIFNPHEIWEALERNGYLGIKNYNPLRKLVEDIDDELTTLIKDAENTISLLRGEVAQNKVEFGGKTLKSKFFESLMHSIVEISKRITESIPMSPVQKFGKIPVELVYSTVVIETDPRYDEMGRLFYESSPRSRNKKITVKGPNDIFYKYGEPTMRIFLKGCAAYGKTTYCVWLLHYWYNSYIKREGDKDEWRDELVKFDLAFFIKLRDVRKSRLTVIDMICDILRVRDREYDKWIRDTLNSGKYRTLIIIDGLDEWKPDETVKMDPLYEGMPVIDGIENCVIFTTVRPWKFDAVANSINSDDRVLIILGLDENVIQTVTERVLTNYYGLDGTQLKGNDKYLRIMKKLENKILGHIMKIPLLAVVCVQIWYKEKDVGNSLTQFFFAMVDMLIERAEKAHEIPNICETEKENIGSTNSLLNSSISFSHTYKSVLSKLRKLAYDGLMSRRTNFEFPAKMLTEKLGLTRSDLDFSLNVGLLSMEETDNVMTEEVKINFFHALLQEFLGAIHIAENEITSITFFEHLSSIEIILEFSNVLIFLSGLDSKIGSLISKHIVRVANSDEEVFKDRTVVDILAYYYNNKIKSIYELQVSCYKEMTYNQGRTSCSDNTSALPFHVSDVDIGFDDDIEKIRTTADILTYHYSEIRSLHMRFVRSDGDDGISNALLTQYLDQAKQLQSLHIDGEGTNRTLYRISYIFYSVTTLLLFRLTITLEAIDILKTAVQSNKVLQTFGLMGIKIQVNDGTGDELESLQCLLQVLPTLPRLSNLSIGAEKNADKKVLQDVLCRLSHLHGIEYQCSSIYENTYDMQALLILCSWSKLHWLIVNDLNLGNFGLELSSSMSEVEYVRLRTVDMFPAGWNNFIQSILKINHAFDVDLHDINIDDGNMMMLRTSALFRIKDEKKI